MLDMWLGVICNIETNSRGEECDDVIQFNNLKLHNRGNTPTFVFPSSAERVGWSAILDLTLSKSQNLELVKNWRVSLEDSMSDHRFIRFEISRYKIIIQPFRNPRKTDWIRFKNLTFSKLRLPHKENLSIDEIEKETNHIIEVFENSFKKSTKISKPSQNKFPPYFNKELINLRRKMRTQFNISYTSNEWEEYRRIRDNYSPKCGKCTVKQSNPQRTPLASKRFYQKSTVPLHLSKIQTENGYNLAKLLMNFY